MPKLCYIKGMGLYVPKKILTNKDLEKMVDTSDEWIITRTGIRERRIASDDENSSDLGVRASIKALENAAIRAEELDLIVVGTATPDMLFPSTACIIQGRIGATKAAAFDLSAGCSGFIYALAVADSLLKCCNWKYALVVGTETLSRVVDWEDRNTCVLFGDGAGAVVLELHEGERGILSTHIHSDGSNWEILYLPGIGAKYPPSPKIIEARLPYIKMQGREVFKIAVKALADVIIEGLEKNGLKESDISLLICHQANLRIIEATAKRLGLTMERVYVNIDRYGNTSSASIPIALYEALAMGLIKPGDIVVLNAFGAGLTWASAIIRW